MKRFVEGLDRGQSTLFPASLDDYVTEDNPVRAVDVFVDSLELDKLGLVGVQPLARPAASSLKAHNGENSGGDGGSARGRTTACGARRARLCDSDVQPPLDGSADLPREHFLVRVKGSIVP